MGAYFTVTALFLVKWNDCAQRRFRRGFVALKTSADGKHMWLLCVQFVVDVVVVCTVGLTMEIRGLSLCLYVCRLSRCALL